MPRRFSSSALPLAMLCFALSLMAQGRAQSGLPGANAIPDLSGNWEAPLGPPRGPCGEPACAEVRGIRIGELLPKLIQILEEPQMLPWAEEQYKVAREGIKDPGELGRQEANPWFSGCMPDSPAALMLNFTHSFELLQFPDVVLLLFSATEGESDHAVRRIFVDGRSHPSDVKPTWTGHSIGRYVGDTLVVDTIGIRGDRWIDYRGFPHSDALHLVERIRRPDQKTLETEVTIDDPKAYRKPWREKVSRQLALPAPILDDVECEELLKMGTHYSQKQERPARSHP